MHKETKEIRKNREGSLTYQKLEHICTNAKKLAVPKNDYLCTNAKKVPVAKND
jgi:hypothetical protein